MRKLILTLAILTLIVQAAHAQTTQPAPPPQGSPATNFQDDTIPAEKKQIQDRWNSMPGSTSSKSAEKTNPSGKKPSPAKTTAQ